MGKRQPIPTVGEQFGELKFLGIAPPHKNGRTQGSFQCSCGAGVVKVLSKVRSGHSRSCGCLRGAGWRAVADEDMVGQRFGRLVVQSRNPRSTAAGGTRWDCLCDCGQSKTLPLNRLRNGNTRSCGCLLRDSASEMGRSRKGKRGWNWKGVGDISRSFWGRIKSGATRRGLAVEVTHEDIWQLFQEQKGRCALTNIAIGFPKVGGRVATASLDRIDSTKGYVEGNIQWIDKRVQQMKWDMPQDEFLSLCEAVCLGAKNHIVGT